MRPDHPRIIQGGMGIGVSHWQLARQVSMAGQLGTVSGTGIWVVLARRLQSGDPGGHMRRALDAFPGRAVADRIYARYYRPDGRADGESFSPLTPMLTQPLSQQLNELLVVASFVEVWLARESHDGAVAVNYLEKIQLAHLPSLYGALLAGVDYVIMGAGIPVQIAEVLDDLAEHKPTSYRLLVSDAERDDVFEARFDPMEIGLDRERIPLKRPYFLPIVSLHVLASMLVRRSRGRIDGFIVEGHTAGGHNAPPRGRHGDSGGHDPVYGDQDNADLEAMRQLGVPFWIAGSQAAPGALDRARRSGAHGIQAGSIFALCNDSAIEPGIRGRAIDAAIGRDGLVVRTDPRSSPSGFPFKQAVLAGTLADPVVAPSRRRICDMGLLRTLFRRAGGELGYRCPSEPEEDYVRKGGAIDQTQGKQCLCNALMATVGLGQSREDWGYDEPPLLTLGKDHGFLRWLARPGGYSAADAVAFLIQPDHVQQRRTRTKVQRVLAR